MSLSWYFTLLWTNLVTTLKKLCYLTIHKHLQCFDLTTSFECCLLNLLPYVFLLILVLILLIVSMTILVCLQLILVQFQEAAVWLHFLGIITFVGSFSSQFSHFLTIQYGRVWSHEILKSQISGEMIIRIVTVG